MAFKLFQDAYGNAQREYMSHVRPEFVTWLNTNQIITKQAWDEWFAAHGMNSYERQLAYSKLDNEVLLEVAEFCLNQCERRDSKRPTSTYDDTMMVHLVPLLIARLKEKTPTVYQAT